MLLKWNREFLSRQRMVLDSPVSYLDDHPKREVFTRDAGPRRHIETGVWVKFTQQNNRMELIIPIRPDQGDLKWIVECSIRKYALLFYVHSRIINYAMDPVR